MLYVLLPISCCVVHVFFWIGQVPRMQSPAPPLASRPWSLGEGMAHMAKPMSWGDTIWVTIFAKQFVGDTILSFGFQCPNQLCPKQFFWSLTKPSLLGGFGTWLAYFSIQLGCHHPNWLIFFRGVAQPPTRKRHQRLVSDL